MKKIFLSIILFITFIITACTNKVINSNNDMKNKDDISKKIDDIIKEEQKKSINENPNDGIFIQNQN